jgi:hypothetical protein
MPMTEATHTDTLQVSNVYRLFVNRVDCFLGWDNGHWSLMRHPFTPAFLTDVYYRPIPFGVQAVSGMATSRWTCFDLDDDERLDALIALYDTLPSASRLWETSRRGAHVWYFHEPVHWEIALAAGRKVADEVGLSDLEVYPRHGGFNAVRLPGTVHPKTGIRYPLIDPHTNEERSFADCFARVQVDPQGHNDFIAPPANRETARVAMSVFHELVGALSALTEITIYGHQRASARCPWHDDAHPSLYIRGRRFHCLACDVYGDIHDLRRWQRSGIRPPGT